jgi:hypothetical protein
MDAAGGGWGAVGDVQHVPGADVEMLCCTSPLTSYVILLHFPALLLKPYALESAPSS